MNLMELAIKSIEEVPGFGNYDDDISSNLSVTSSPTKLTINGLGSQSNEDYLPYAIRGTSSLWNTTTNKITPINIGDEYNLRIDFNILTKSGSTSKLNLILDIGNLATPSIPIVERDISVTKTTPFSISVGFPVYALDTFKANGGQIFLSTDTGIVTIGQRDIYISRISNGQR